MGRIVVLVGSLVVGFALVWLGQRLPAPLPAHAPPAVFSAERAMNDVRAIALRPHPIGSAENARVRDYLLTRAGQLGLSAEVQRGAAVQGRGFGEGDRVLGVGTSENVLMRLAGRDPSPPPLLLMAHYDSVPGSPGAADDAMGAASLLEVARALRAGGPPARDVFFLFTDGEEAGLFGARLFFGQHPLARRLGAVVNLEARGSSGQAVMFETGAGNGAMMGAYGDAVARPAANSLTGFVYRNLPNDTDFTLARTAGLPGFNIAPIGDQQDYHSPSATPANVNRQTLQHMGDQALSLARRLSSATALPPRTGNAVYFDAFGLGLVRYPAWCGWFVVVAAAVVWAAATLHARFIDQARLSDVRRGALAFLFVTAIAALALTLARRLVPGDTTLAGLRPILVQFHLYEVGSALLVGAAVLGTAAALVRGGGIRLLYGLPLLAVVVLLLTGGWNSPVVWLAVVGLPAGWWALSRTDSRPAGVASGLALALLIVAFAAQILAPEAAFFFGWPALGAAVGLLAWGLTPGRVNVRSILAMAPGVVMFGGAALFGHLLLVSLGAEAPQALAILAPLSLTLLAPALLRVGELSRAPAAAFLLLATGAAVFGVVALRRPYGPRSPEATQVVQVAEPAAGRYARVSLLDRLDPWSLAALGGEPQRRPMPELFARQAWSAPAPAISAVAASVARGTDARGATLTLAAPGSRELRVMLSAATDLTGVEVAGISVPARGRVFRVRYTGREALTLRLPGVSVEQVHGSVAAVGDGWPSGAASPPRRPPAAAPWGQSDGLVTVTRF